MKSVWLDADPGHDDATAILLALHDPNIRLLGVSTTHGNAPSECTAINAARCLVAFGAPKNVFVYPGAAKPLLLPARYDPEIHGLDGLGGVENFPLADAPEVLSRFATDPQGSKICALEGMSKIIRETWKEAGSKVVVVATGPMTNIALFVAAYPDLLPAVQEFVFMGGGVGLGNRSAVAEYNIMCDPHAAQIMLDAPVKKVMIPINVTHTVIITKERHSRLLSLLDAQSANYLDSNPPPTTRLRHALSTLIGFFAESYKSTFGFEDGPPLHDALTIGYVSQPELFQTIRKRVDIELSGTHTTGETVVDLWNYRSCDDTWGPTGRNCLVAQGIDVDRFFDILLECVAACDKTSPLNKT